MLFLYYHNSKTKYLPEQLSLCEEIPIPQIVHLYLKLHKGSEKVNMSLQLQNTALETWNIYFLRWELSFQRILKSVNAHALTEKHNTSKAYPQIVLYTHRH